MECQITKESYYFQIIITVMIIIHLKYLLPTTNTHFCIHCFLMMKTTSYVKFRDI